MRCVPVTKSIGWFSQKKRVINFDPIYQREAGAWSKDRKTLFIDSLLNNYDIPKIYLHELEQNGYEYTVIDGKQRITTMLDFLEDKFELAEGFEYSGGDLSSSDAPLKNQKFSQFPEAAKQHLKDIQLAITLVQKADDEEIESLFTRLNDGEPLNSAEYRNGIGGAMVALVRTISEHDFFEKYVSYSNKRFAYRETSCRLLYIESELQKKRPVPDIKKASLDDFVRDNKNIPESEVKKLQKAVSEQLNFASKCFAPGSKELGKQSLPQLYYYWLREVRLNYGHLQLQIRLKAFIEDFLKRRIENNLLPEQQRDQELSKFSYLSGQGTNNADSLLGRAEILTKRFLEQYPDTQILDKKRLFTADEKFVIWMRANKCCQQCGVELASINDFHADHVEKWAHGGVTLLENAQALCEKCNLQKG